MDKQPWHGVLVANPVALDRDLEIDFDRYAEHITWLAESGCDGITPNGSLGEYQTLTEEERRQIIQLVDAFIERGQLKRRSGSQATSG